MTSIGIIGLGYWGNNIRKTLIDMGYENIITCDSNIEGVDLTDYTQMDRVSHVFIATPASTHHRICNHFLQRGVNVFCEKPLSLSLETCEALYSTAKKNGCNLFVDWIYIFNTVIKSIKSFILDSNKKPKNVVINRLNKGPVRKDVSARWDLASHDVSIALYLFGKNNRTRWMDFHRDSNTDYYWDSVTGVLSYDETTVQINCSWAYDRKVRDMVVEFEDGFIKWDELTQTIESTVTEYDTNVLVRKFLESESPLATSIDAFINQPDLNYEFQRQLTLDITRILSYES